MAYENYECLRISVEDRIARLTIDHPPINLFDFALILEMDRVATELAADAEVTVVIVDSANPDFFIAHADVTLIEGLPENPGPAEAPSLFQSMVSKFENLPQATIGVIEGIARGGGSEFLLGLDMRFALEGRAVLAQPEVALGIIPGGGGCQRLPRLVGRGRALEVILGCMDFDARDAERYGYVNRAMPEPELRDYVERLAGQIASYPLQAVARAKRAAAAALPDPEPGMIVETDLFNETLSDPDTRRRMRGFMEHGGQTAELEAAGDLGEALKALGES